MFKKYAVTKTPLSDEGANKSRLFTPSENPVEAVSWQATNVDIQFFLLFEGDSDKDAIAVYLPCQCHSANAQLNVDAETNDALSYIALCVAPQASFSSDSFSCSKPVTLKLYHQSTWVTVAGFCQNFNEESSSLHFIFDDCHSMQARMILQLVKICQMRAEINTDDSSFSGDLENPRASDAIAGAAKSWSKDFAADFAKKFDNNN